MPFIEFFLPSILSVFLTFCCLRNGDWIDLAEDRDIWRAVLNAVIKLRAL